MADLRENSSTPAAVMNLTEEQSKAIAAAKDTYGLCDPYGTPVCLRRRENESAQPSCAVAFTPEQWETAVNAGGTVEVRSHDGVAFGYLVLNPHVNLFYTVENIEFLLKRAREPRPGRTLGEILGDVLARAGA